MNKNLGNLCIILSEDTRLEGSSILVFFWGKDVGGLCESKLVFCSLLLFDGNRSLMTILSEKLYVPEAFPASRSTIVKLMDCE